MIEGEHSILKEHLSTLFRVEAVLIVVVCGMCISDYAVTIMQTTLGIVFTLRLDYFEQLGVL